MLLKGDVLEIEELIYLDSTALMKLCNAALFEKDVVELHVSEAEDFKHSYSQRQRLKHMVLQWQRLK